MSEPATGAPADDRGLLLADGLFETVLFTAGRPALWTQHVERMVRGCRVLGLPAPAPDRLAEAARQALVQAELTGARAAVRLTWTAGSGGRGLERPDQPQPRLIASAAPATRADGPVRLATVAIRRNEQSPTSRIKSLAYLDHVLARSAARATGADEALMLNTRGDLAGCAAANLFWIDGDRLCTPDLECGVLDGIMRAQVMKVALQAGLEPAEMRCGPEALAKATAVFITNSLIGVRPASALNGAPLGDDARIAVLARILREVSWALLPGRAGERRLQRRGDGGGRTARRVG